MKAERLKKSEEFLNAYLGGNRNISTLTWDYWIECLQDYAEQYARIQIEKDRERVLMQIYEDDGAELNSTSFSKTPIILD